LNHGVTLSSLTLEVWEPVSAFGVFDWLQVTDFNGFNGSVLFGFLCSHFYSLFVVCQWRPNCSFGALTLVFCVTKIRAKVSRNPNRIKMIASFVIKQEALREHLFHQNRQFVVVAHRTPKSIVKPRPAHFLDQSGQLLRHTWGRWRE
jgi:hypothetical protein